MASNTSNAIKRWLPILVAALSVASLLQDVFDYGFTFTLAKLLAWYNTLSKIALGWLQPILLWVLDHLRGLFEFDLHLGEHWRHVFVLLGLYYARDYSSFFSRGDRTGGSLMLVLGIVISLISAVASGTMPITTSDFYVGFVTCAIPLWGLAVYRTLRSIWATVKYQEDPNAGIDFLNRATASLTDVAFGFVIAIHLLMFQAIRSLSNVYIAVLALMIFLFALRQAVNGWIRSSGQHTSRKERISAFWRHGNTVMARDILAVYGVVFGFVCANAGLSRFGL